MASVCGAWFCGIAVRIKPAFTQLNSQCFLQPLLLISTLVLLQLQPELLCVPLVIHDILQASVPACIPELDPPLLWFFFGQASSILSVSEPQVHTSNVTIPVFSSLYFSS